MASIESVVSFLVDKLTKLLVEEVALLKGIRTEASKIKIELERLRAIIRGAGSRVETDEWAKAWVKEVREAAFDIEDVLDDFLHRLLQVPHQEGTGILGFLPNHDVNCKRLRIHQGIADQMQKIDLRVAHLGERASYSFQGTEQVQSSNTLSARVNDLRTIARFADKDDLVGIDRSSNQLIQWLLEGEPRLMTVAVVGMGGLGKTTVAGLVYDSEPVKRHFQCRAWVTVSQYFRTDEIFRRLVKKFYGGSVQEADTLGMNQLIEMLREFLREKRYVIVLDDIWKKIDWDSIKTGLPIGGSGSRILVTTRIHDVADALDQSYRLEPLSEDESFELFCRKAFQPEFRGRCPSDLVYLSRNFVRRCAGLPLAIIAIGLFLSSKPRTALAWQHLYDSLEYEMERSDILAAMKQILFLSLDDLPYSLKTCFYYVSIFPQDYPIKRNRLINLWAAEGFVERAGDRTLEDVADNYLNNLIGRSLIQVVRRTDYGAVITCRVHGLVHEMILLEFKKGNFATALVGQNMKLSANPRRLFIHCRGEAAPKVSNIESLPQLRSFFMFDVLDDNFDAFINVVFKGFRFLRVLDLEGLPISTFPHTIVNLLFLRLLSLRNTKIGKLPLSIVNLQQLETLDIRGTDIEELTPNVLKLRCLRHLLARTSHKTSVNLAMPRSGVGNIALSLQTLAYIAVDRVFGRISELQKLVRLRRLGIDRVRSEDEKDLCASIENMPNLSILSVFAEGNEVLNLQYISSPPQSLQHLHLKGSLQSLPNWIPSLSSLIRLRLESSQLTEDPLRAFQHLTHLLELELSLAYDGDELCCMAGGFPRLQLLHINQLNKLTKVTLELGAMERLQKLWLYHCSELQRVPSGIEHLNLKELRFSAVRDELKRSIARDGGEDHWKISRIPVVKFD